MRRQFLAFKARLKHPPQSPDEAQPDIHQGTRAYEEALNLYHPHTVFFKTLPNDATFLDLGAGDGSMVHFRTWLEPKRADVKCYAYSLEAGQHFHLYDGFELGDWEHTKPDFSGRKFDAIYSGHFIEHVDDPYAAVEWCISRLSPRGRLYLEWPSEFSLRSPTHELLTQRGLKVMIGNYRDDLNDAGHRLPIPNKDRIVEIIQNGQLVIEQSGFVRIPYLEEGLNSFNRDMPGSYPLQAAFWSATRWCQYLIASRAAPLPGLQGAGIVISDDEMKSHIDALTRLANSSRIF